MRLAIVNQDYRSDGALERMQEPALEALLERNVAITLLTRAWPKTKLKLMEPVICNPFHMGTYWRERGFARVACRTIRAAPADLVESRDPLDCCDVHHAWDGVHAARVAAVLRHGATAARTALSASPVERYRVRAEQRMYRSRWLRAVICHSRMVRDEVVGRFGFSEAKVRVVYPSIDAELHRPASGDERARERQRLGVAAGAVVYAAVADAQVADGVAATIDALAALPEDSQLVVAGDNAAIARARRRARARGCAARVHFAADRDPRACFAAADVLVRPSMYEPSPVVPLAAMASGLAVVTSVNSGAAELVHEHDCGLVCDASDIGAISAQMEALRDPARRERLRENARAAVLPFTPAAVTLELVLLYRDLLAAALVERATDDAGREAAAAPGLTPARPESAGPALRR